MAYDSNNGGWGTYTTLGPTFGLAASGGVEFGVYSGDMNGISNIFTLGVPGIAVGFIWGENLSDVGISIAFGLGLPVELSYSRNITTFDPCNDEKILNTPLPISP
jgi:hypothetical protein